MLEGNFGIVPWAKVWSGFVVDMYQIQGVNSVGSSIDILARKFDKVAVK